LKPHFRLGTKLAPEWSGIADSLGEAYEAVDESELAIGEYRRVLSLNPAEGHSIERLKALGAKTPAKAAGG
jgi:predicted TPR repeat methyltransferase